MGFLSKIVDVAAIRSDSPIRRLVAYYAILLAITATLVYFVPVLDVLFSGERLEELTSTPSLLEDGMSTEQLLPPTVELPDRVNLAIITTSVMLGTVLLMLPVTWVYMATGRRRGYSQPIVQTLLILPIVVAGIVLIVRNSLALAFSLAGIVAGVRFRNALKDPRDAVFIFLAIGVGLAAGVQALTVAFLLSLVYNLVTLTVWRFDFGRNVLAPSPGAQWTEPLAALAERDGAARVPDRDLMLALSPEKAQVLADRFARLQQLVAGEGRKPRYNAVVWLTTEAIGEAQPRVERVLSTVTRRWRLDEVVQNDGKPSELYYLVKIRKNSSPDEIVTALRAEDGTHLMSAEVQTSDALADATAA